MHTPFFRHFYKLINPKMLKTVNEKNLSLFLHCTTPPVKAKFNVSILNAKREEETVRREEKVYYFSKEKHSSWGYDYVMFMDMLLSKAKVLLPEDKLTITCGIGEVNIVNISHQSKILHCKVIEENLTEDLGNLFDNEKCSDIALSVEEHEIKAHRAILTASGDGNDGVNIVNETLIATRRDIKRKTMYPVIGIKG
uniref:BTB domain-containing protein n=1 Tax=Glossina austeni TaxID=7395 RepID=A0A1A9VSK8_GLOAU